MSDDYYDEFLDSDDVDESPSEQLPNWVNAKNSSQKAYEAIESLKEFKQQYIRKHSLKSHYQKKSSYQISKTEVANLAGAKSQPLFNSCTYSESLKRHLDTVNNELDEYRERRIKSKGGGLRQKKKEELLKELQQSKINNDQLLKNTVDELFEKTMNHLPLDVRRKLGIKS